MDWIELHKDGEPRAVNLRLVEVFQRPLDNKSSYATRIFFLEAEDYVDVDETYEEIWDMIKEREAVSHAR